MGDVVLQPPPQDVWVQELPKHMSHSWCSSAVLNRGCFSPNEGFSLRFVQDALRESYKYHSASCAALQGGSCFPSGGRRQQASSWVQAAVCAGAVGGSSSCTPLPGPGMGRSARALLLCIRLDLAWVFLERRAWGGCGRMLGRVRSLRSIQRERGPVAPF